MKKLHFTYDMQIEYSIPVVKCNYTIKCVPRNTLRQEIENIQIKLSPESVYSWGTDGFRNLQIYGANNEPHSSFRFQIEGDAVAGLCEYEELVDYDQAMIFAHPHGLNAAGNKIKEFFKEKESEVDSNIYESAIRLMRVLYDSFEYQSCTTNVDTSAEEAFAQGHGVCQDYAHIFIAMLHQAKIPARYITGFIIGEGQSHAWVEFLDNGRWYGIDPTNNKMVDDEYIKIGQGRDAKDCMINRGIMHGGGLHTQIVNVNVIDK